MACKPFPVLVARRAPARSGNDWHADYEDWRVKTRRIRPALRLLVVRGPPLARRHSRSPARRSTIPRRPLALLILAPVTLVLPDPDDFGTVGLAPATAVNLPGTSHTVTATARAVNGALIPGTTIDFSVLSGPNAGKVGSDVTDANGRGALYLRRHQRGPVPKTDRIQASIGNLKSNIVEKTWAQATTKCDTNSDGDIDSNDLLVIRMANGQVATGPGDPRDGNSDKKITSPTRATASCGARAQAARTSSAIASARGHPAACARHCKRLAHLKSFDRFVGVEEVIFKTSDHTMQVAWGEDAAPRRLGEQT